MVPQPVEVFADAERERGRFAETMLPAVGLGEWTATMPTWTAQRMGHEIDRRLAGALVRGVLRTLRRVLWAPRFATLPRRGDAE